MPRGPVKPATGRGNDFEAAEGPTEQQIAGIWRDILGHGEFGRDEDFFDLGGDSLQAMALLTAIEQKLGKRLPFESLILNGATIADLTQRISLASTGAGEGACIPLNQGGSPAVLVAMPPVGGHLSDYLELAHAFKGVCSLIGIRGRGVDGNSAPDSTAESIAEYARQLLEEAGVTPPFDLIGYSSGAAGDPP